MFSIFRMYFGLSAGAMAIKALLQRLKSLVIIAGNAKQAGDYPNRQGHGVALDDVAFARAKFIQELVGNTTDLRRQPSSTRLCVNPLLTRRRNRVWRGGSPHPA
jgi:hypothetical protein